MPFDRVSTRKHPRKARIVREMDYLVLGHVSSKPYRYVHLSVRKLNVSPRVTRIDAAQATVEPLVNKIYAIQAGRRKGRLSRNEKLFVASHTSPYSTRQFYADLVQTFWNVDPDQVFAVAIGEKLWNEATQLRNLLEALPELKLVCVVQSDGFVKQV